MDVLGWVGTGLVVLAYGALTLGLMGPRERIYQGLNLLGSILLGLSLWDAQSWPAFTLQVVWALVALVGLIRR